MGKFRDSVTRCIRRVWTLAVLLPGLLTALAGCSPMTNYEDAAMPRFAGTHARGGMVFDGILDVVTWNIQHAEEIDAAINELQTMPELQNIPSFEEFRAAVERSNAAVAANDDTAAAEAFLADRSG